MKKIIISVIAVLFVAPALALATSQKNNLGEDFQALLKTVNTQVLLGTNQLQIQREWIVVAEMDFMTRMREQGVFEDMLDKSTEEIDAMFIEGKEEQRLANEKQKKKEEKIEEARERNKKSGGLATKIKGLLFGSQ